MMFTDSLVLHNLKELISWFESAEDPMQDFPCFDSSELSRSGVSHILMWLLDENNWAKDAVIENFNSDPRTATGVDPLSPCGAHYFRLYNDNGVRNLLVVYSRPVGRRDGINEHRATYIIEYDNSKQQWKITRAYAGL